MLSQSQYTSAAVAGYSGVAHFTGGGTQGSYNVDIAYAVFAPGAFPSALDPTPGSADPSDLNPNAKSFSYPTQQNGTNSQYIYAYQVLNQTLANNSVALNLASIYFDPRLRAATKSTQLGQPNFISSVGEADPSNLDPGGNWLAYSYYSFANDATEFNFLNNGTGLAPGEESQLLFQSSTLSPVLQTGQTYTSYVIAGSEQSNLPFVAAPASFTVTNPDGGINGAATPLPKSWMQLLLLLVLVPFVSLAKRFALARH